MYSLLSQQQLTPQSHEYREEDSGGVVKEMAGSRRSAGRVQPPVATGTVAKWTHGDVAPWVTDLHAGMERDDSQLQHQLTVPHFNTIEQEQSSLIPLLTS